MDPQRRASIIKTSMAILARHRHDQGQLDGASPGSPAARSVDSQSSADAAPGRDTVGLSRRLDDVPPPIEDDLTRWRREAEELEAQREEAKAALRAEEERSHVDAAELFWQEVDRRINAALEVERQAISEILVGGFTSMVDLSKTFSDKVDDMESKIEVVRGMLAQSRERTARELGRARERADDAALGEFPPTTTKTVN
jgi:hypothetical protein